MGMMRRSRRWLAKLLAVTTAVSLLAPGAIPAGAVTELTQSEYDEIVSRYTISKEAVGYKEYLCAYDQVRPQTELTVEGADYVRYEQQDSPAVPRILENYQGMAGSSVLTAEDSLIEYAFTVSAVCAHGMFRKADSMTCHCSIIRWKARIPPFSAAYSWMGRFLMRSCPWWNSSGSGRWMSPRPM